MRKVEDCENRSLNIRDGTIDCKIIWEELNEIHIAGPGMANYPCDRCFRGWVKGEPPSSEEETWSPELRSLILDRRQAMQGVEEDEEGTMTLASPPTLPTFKEMVSNFGSAMLRWGKAGFSTVSKEEFNKRKSICESCEYWQGMMGRCKICGCVGGVKLHLATEKCPDHPPRWNEVHK